MKKDKKMPLAKVEVSQTAGMKAFRTEIPFYKHSKNFMACQSIYQKKGCFL